MPNWRKSFVICDKNLYLCLMYLKQWALEKLSSIPPIQPVWHWLPKENQPSGSVLTEGFTSYFEIQMSVNLWDSRDWAVLSVKPETAQTKASLSLCCHLFQFLWVCNMHARGGRVRGGGYHDSLSVSLALLTTCCCGSANITSTQLWAERQQEWSREEQGGGGNKTPAVASKMSELKSHLSQNSWRVLGTPW